jgi:UDP-N-acetylmuramoyl-tripeptide--D-alanyl-D-alanine ligase
MHWKLSDIPRLLDSPAGRWHLWDCLILNLRPVLVPLAGVCRRSFLRNTRMAVVTGSFGKTTTTRALKAALFHDPESQSNRNPESFVALEIMNMPRSGVQQAVFELGIDRPGVMTRLAWMILPDIAVVTSIGSEHHPAFGTLDKTRNEKALIVKALPRTGLAVLNGDDPNVLWMKDQTRARVVTFGFNKENDVRAEVVELDWPRGTNIRVRGFGQTRTLRIRLFGWPMVYAVLAAIATALAEGFSLNKIATPLETMSPTAGRLHPVPLPNDVWLVRDEFKGTQETIEAALNVIADIPAKRRIVVLGMVFEPRGNQNELYERLGALAAQVAHQVFFVGNKRERDSLFTGAVKAGLARKNITCVKKAVPDAFDALRRMLRPGDVILVKGRAAQRLERIALALWGRKVRCTVKECKIRISLRCDHCKMLERGWEEKRIM